MSNPNTREKMTQPFQVVDQDGVVDTTTVATFSTNNANVAVPAAVAGDLRSVDILGVGVGGASITITARSHSASVGVSVVAAPDLTAVTLGTILGPFPK